MTNGQKTLCPRVTLISGIVENKNITAADATRLLGVSKPTAIHHLHQLLRAGIVRLAAPPRSNRRGRPAHTYTLANGVEWQLGDFETWVGKTVVNAFRARGVRTPDEIAQAVLAWVQMGVKE